MKTLLKLAAAVLASAVVIAADRAPGNDTITKAALRADLYFLSSDDMQGRLTNTLTNRIAADWIASRFERMGLKPAGPGGSYFQPYDLMVETLGPVEQNQLELAGNTRVGLKYGADFYPQRFSATGTAEGDVIFVGFGITSPERHWDDYKGAALNGKIALVIDHEPGERDPASPFDGLVTSDAANPLRKAIYAQEHGAAGILFVSDVHNHPSQGAPGPPPFEATARNAWPATPPRIDRFSLATWIDTVHIPALEVSPAIAEALVQGSGRSLAELSASAEAPGGITPVPLGRLQRVKISAAVQRHRVPDRNVLGIIEGSDSKLRDETVVVCAHLDHDGADGTRIFNGADDDGSGIVALIEIAAAYAGQTSRPRRTVLFAAWNSEERGLLGAYAYTESPTRPLDKIVAVLNMDMLGRNEEVPPEGGPRFRGLEPQTSASNNNAVNVIGTSRSSEMRTAVDAANGAIGLDVRYRYDNNISQLMRRSDHWPFLNRGIPAIWFHTGLHPDYHTPQDTPDRINYDKMEKIARLIHQMSWDLANADGRPKLAGRATNPM